MTQFLYRAARDSQVGPWLMPVMAQTDAYGSDGFNQHFGLNALSGVHGSKQGWGDDSFWTARESTRSTRSATPTGTSSRSCSCPTATPIRPEPPRPPAPS